MSRLATLAGVLVAVGLVAGCRNDMQRGPRVDPLTPNDFFPNGAGSRTLVEGTVARGQLRADSAFYTGRLGGELVAGIPIPVDTALLERGQNRFNIYCAPCHSRLGDGQGMVPSRGFQKMPASFHIDRLRGERNGYIFDVITNGFGNMQDYSMQLPPRDRWAVVAYVRVLQLSQNATLADVPDADRAKLESAAPATPAEPPAQGAPPHE